MIYLLFVAKVKRKWHFHGMKLQHQKFILSFLAINLFCFSINAQQHGASTRSGYELSRLKDPTTGKIPMDIRLKELAFAQTLPKSTDADGIALRGTPWYHRGPFNIGGRTRAFGIDVANENLQRQEGGSQTAQAAKIAQQDLAAQEVLYKVAVEAFLSGKA